MKARLVFIILSGFFLAAVAIAMTSQRRPAPSVKWLDCLDQNQSWYGSAEAVRIADNVLLYQRESGGWPKNIEMAAVLSETEVAALLDQKKKTDSTIDNTATYTQLAYLALVFQGARQPRFRDAFMKGLDYLLKAQYENGGWPQYYPKLTHYYTHITFNDDAMVGVMNLLREIAQKKPTYTFVDEARRARCERAIDKGIECILKCQVVVDGKRTVWCAQHDEVTFKPAPARAYEKISLSGFESVGIVRFLMGINQPSPQVTTAIESAVAWFEQTRLNGIKLVKEPNASMPKGYDLLVVQEPKADPLWARFYEIGTNRPIFCGRNGLIKYSLAEIEVERRTGYNWYVSTPARLLSQDYPAWIKKWGRGKRS
ncbi:MAG TPA: pectate lyase [Blastocatellia bacterium]|nr:pectate lyase [Blastocatellia bacterium]